MSDDDALYGRPETERQQGYSPMPSATPREPEEEFIIRGTGRDDMLDAAQELTEARGTTYKPEVIDRHYIEPATGEERPKHETVTKERFVEDLARQRSAEVDAIVQVEDRVIADAIDEVKGVPTQTAQEEALTEWRAQQAQLAAQQQAQQQEQPPPGVDAELYELLRNNPKVSQALQAELNQVEAARKQYATSAFQSAQIAAASLVASEPMLQGISPDQMSTALLLLERQSPEKAASVREHLGRVQQLYNIAQNAKAQEAQIQAQSDLARIQGYMRSQEVLFEHSMKSENPDTVRQVKAEIGDIIQKDYGISKEELAHAFRTNSALHSAAFQKMMYDAAKYKIAQRTAARAAPKPVLPVQRPGVAGNYSGDGEIESARSEFLKRPTARSAAALIAARRRSA